MLRDTSPALGLTYFASTNVPPSPPFSTQNDPLDDIYGSAPASPVLATHSPLSFRDRADEILSDLPSRQRAFDVDAYREGLSNSKGQFVQEGFDEGYSLGAELGQRVGYILGVLQGLVTALRGNDEVRWQEARGLWVGAQKELAIQELLGKECVDEEGIWKWEVHGKEEEVTFREVADQHPAVKRWMEKIREVAKTWRVDLEVVDRDREVATDEQS